MNQKLSRSRWTYNKVAIGFKVAHLLWDTTRCNKFELSFSRGSVATQFRCGGQCYILFCWKFNRLYSSERILKIGKYLTKLSWQENGAFFGTRCTSVINTQTTNIAMTYYIMTYYIRAGAKRLHTANITVLFINLCINHTFNISWYITLCEQITNAAESENKHGAIFRRDIHLLRPMCQNPRQRMRILQSLKCRYIF